MTQEVINTNEQAAAQPPLNLEEGSAAPKGEVQETQVPPDQPSADEARAAEAAPVATAEAEAPAAERDSEAAALKAELAALKDALESRASSDELGELRSGLAEAQRSLSEVQEKAVEEAARANDGLQQEVEQVRERVAALDGNVQTLGRTVRGIVTPEVVEPGAVPPLVLQQAYETVLTELFQEMTRIYGGTAPKVTQTIMEGVRKSCSGMEFFRIVDDRRIVAAGLADALRRKLLSPYQVHLTYNELFRQMSAQVPLYRPQPLAELVSARISAYTVSTISRLAEQVDQIVQGQEKFSARLDSVEARVQEALAAATARAEKVEGQTAATAQAARKGPRYASKAKVRAAPPKGSGEESSETK